ncbi:MAG: hypothetical protein Q9M50_09370 [Methylococcales bacterium]|nr:hypothetical protein [Methylococcales bacterium]
MMTVIPTVHSAEWSMDAKIKQSTSYDDNVRMEENGKGSLIYKLTPALNFSHKTEISEISGSINYGIQRYLSISSFNQDSQKYQLKGNYKTERSYWSGNVSLNMAPVRNTAEEDSGNFTSNAEKMTRSVALFYAYQLTELDRLTLLPSYSENTYSKGDFSDNKNSNISLAWSHEWTERYSSSISVFYSTFSSQNSTRATLSNSYGINYSSTYWWSENLQLSSSLGVRMTASENRLANFVDKTKGMGFLSNTAINYKAELYRVKLNVSRSLVPSSTGQLNEQNRVSLNLDYDLSEHLTAGFLVSYQVSKSASSNSDQTSVRKNSVLQPSINWKIARDWRISANYRYRQQDRGSDSAVVASNSVMVSINYNWQGLSIAR